jgi:hypothetical protein
VQQKGVGVRKFVTDDGDDEVGQTYFAHDGREVSYKVLGTELANPSRAYWRLLIDWVVPWCISNIMLY